MAYGFETTNDDGEAVFWQSENTFGVHVEEATKFATKTDADNTLLLLQASGTLSGAVHIVEIADDF